MSEKIKNHEQSAFEHQEMIQFPDGSMALGFREDGDRVELGVGSMHKYAREFRLSPLGSGGDLALVSTKSGNKYLIGNGVVVNTREKMVFDMPDNIEFTIGKPAFIDGISSTSDITSVFLRYPKTYSDGYEGAVQSSRENPFHKIESSVLAAREQLEAHRTKDK